VRISKVLLGIAVVAVLSGCGTGTPAPPSAEALAGAGESATKSAIVTAKVAAVAYFTSNPDETTVSPDQLAEYGYGADAVPVAFHVTAPDDFCVDAVAASGAKFKATLESGIEDGPCIAGDDF